MLESKVSYRHEAIKYIPALGLGALTPFFDSLQKWGAKESTFKPELIKQTRISMGFNVLDLGCGTGTLTILAKKSQPMAQVKGIDIDPCALCIAKHKACQEGLCIQFDLGTAFDLPYQDNFFDRVISSLVFHHLTRENKIRTLKEIYRVLKADGELHIADIGKPHNLVMHLPSAIMGRLEETDDNVRGLLPKMFKIAGFQDVKVTLKTMTIFGTVSLYEGRKP